jgi:hypothetical protein
MEAVRMLAEVIGPRPACSEQKSEPPAGARIGFVNRVSTR